MQATRNTIETTFEEICEIYTVDLEIEFDCLPACKGLAPSWNHGGTPDEPAEADYVNHTILKVTGENGEVEATNEIRCAVETKIQEDLQELEADALEDLADDDCY